jgi:hypothetical protein
VRTERVHSLRLCASQNSSTMKAGLECDRTIRNVRASYLAGSVVAPAKSSLVPPTEHAILKQSIIVSVTESAKG